MDLEPYVEALQVELVSAADAGGDEARALAARLMSPLDAAIRLTLQDALVAAAEEITRELAPGSVELRFRGRDPEFVVTAPPEPEADDTSEPGDAMPDPTAPVSPDGDDGGMARINLRMTEQLKGRVEQAAAGQGISVNGWLVRAATVALDRRPAPPQRDLRSGRGPQRYSGWAR